MIYIRQSSPHQVLTNQESLRLQYALQQRALELGWRPEDIDIIDADVGLTATGTRPREGFTEIVTKVTLGQVGIILSYEVTRLSRNGSDGSPLLDICGYRRCLIADRDGVYDPATANGRLLLGLKGQLSEMELHTIRSREAKGLAHQAVGAMREGNPSRAKGLWTQQRYLFSKQGPGDTGRTPLPRLVALWCGKLPACQGM